jgi:hypothetical protein
MSGARRTISGSVKGTGAMLEVRSIGFRPTKVELKNVGAGLCSADWNEAMPDASMFKRVTAGTATFPLTNGITPLSDGFRLGADANLNIAGQTIIWTATD